MEYARPRPLPAFEAPLQSFSLPTRRLPTAWTAMGGALVLLLLVVTPAPAQEKESIFNRVVHLEDSLFTTVPQVPRLEGSLVLAGAAPGISADLGQSRQQMFISDEERGKMREIRNQLRALAPERGWSDAEYTALFVYNNHVNGDWKRQHYYKPSPERMAQIALYEWVQDGIFNGRMGQSAERVNTPFTRIENQMR